MKHERMTGKKRLLVGTAVASAVFITFSLALAFGDIRLVVAFIQLTFALTFIVWLARFRLRQHKVTEDLLQKISRLAENMKQEREASRTRSTRRSRRGHSPDRRTDRRW